MIFIPFFEKELFVQTRDDEMALKDTRMMYFYLLKNVTQGRGIHFLFIVSPHFFICVPGF